MPVSTFVSTRRLSTAAVCAVAMIVLSAGAANSKPPEDPSKTVLPLTALEISGNQAVSREEIINDLKLKPGSRTDLQKVQDAFARLRRAYVNRGYFTVRLSTSVEASPVDLRASVYIAEGPLFRLGTLEVTGNDQVARESILRELEIQPGDIFSPARLREGNKRLYASGCFDIVDLVLSTSPLSIVDVIVKVRERKKSFIKGGAGYGSETKERLSLGFEDQNFLGSARRADIKYTWSGFLTEPEKYETRLLEGTVIQPFAFNTRMEGRLTVERSVNFRAAYDDIENEIRGSLERRFTSAFSLTASYRFQGTELTRVSPEAQTPDDTSIDAVSLSVRYDTTDDPFLPVSGFRILGAVEEGLEVFANDVGFHKVEARVGRFDTIDAGWTFFEGVQSGLIVPRSGLTSDLIPINERYFLGGANTVRGYYEKSLGPKDAEGNPLGGAFFVAANLEARHKLFNKIFGVVFFDAGNLYSNDPYSGQPFSRITNLDTLRYSCGAGARYHSPFGAIRLEVGYQLNPEAGNDAEFLDRTAFHFSIGEVF